MAPKLPSDPTMEDAPEKPDAVYQLLSRLFQARAESEPIAPKLPADPAINAAPGKFAVVFQLSV